MSRPTWARELKRFPVITIETFGKSRPTWARELKPSGSNRKQTVCRSRPTWARELKPVEKMYEYVKDVVAPHVGA